MGGVSCSVVKPGDIFHGDNDWNATGQIGVVIDPLSKDSLVAVDPHDCGSIEDEHGNRTVLKEHSISVDDLANTLTQRNGYNEWVMKNYRVIGIFAAPPIQVSVLEVPEYPPELPDSLRDNIPGPGVQSIDIDEVKEEFPNLPLYIFQNNQIFQFNDAEPNPVAHTEIY